jgi:DNA-directed RNA polymerase specialized sigma24 family protein
VVAQALRRPLGTVKRQLHEARQQLAESLKEVP